MAITDVAHDAVDYVPPAEVQEEELYHPKTWLGKYVFSQDAKIIALQYSITAMAVGLIALILFIDISLPYFEKDTFGETCRDDDI